VLCCPVPAGVVYALQMCSHLARNSEVYFPALREAFPASRLGALLVQLSSAVRAKTCNLIGNLCRHSGSWYGLLAQPVYLRQGQGQGPPAYDSLLAALINCCADADDSTRKFACFAVGNAAFHSGELYPRLAAAVPPLLSALDDADEKTRANAAGALGNLVRNGPALAGELCAQGAVDRLIVMCLRESVVFPQRIALFSLGTMAGHGECRSSILRSRHGIGDVVHTLKHQQPMAADGAMQKYLSRLKSKLKKQQHTPKEEEG
jgi:fused-like protein